MFTDYSHVPKIIVLGKDSVAKTAVIIALNPNTEIIDLQCSKQLQGSSTKTTTLAIYIEEEPNQQIIDQLHGIFKSIILIARKNISPNINDLFVCIGIFEDFTAKSILEEIRVIREFISKSQSLSPRLNNIQQRVFLELAKGLPDEVNWRYLNLSRSKYFSILEQLRMLYDVEKNWQLVQLSKELSLTQAS
jgi:hypothetical protein